MYGWTYPKEEICFSLGIVENHNIWIISDEIHCDILRQGVRHIPMAKVMPDYLKLITCTSVSKAVMLSSSTTRRASSASISRCRVTWDVKNEDATEMVFSIGAHPAFRCPIVLGETLEDCYLQFNHEDKTANGKSPVREFLLTLDAKIRTKVLRNLKPRSIGWKF